MRIVVRPAARRDILLQVGYYIDELAFEAAERFPLAVEKAVDEIREQPGIGSPKTFDNPKLAGVRSWPIPGFEDVLSANWLCLTNSLSRTKECRSQVATVGPLSREKMSV